MAVILEGFNLVVRNVTLDGRLPGGVGGVLRDAPNGMACTDGRVTRLGFMDGDDLERFRSRLEAQGVAEAEVASISAAAPGEAPEWLRVGRYAGAMAAWLPEADPEPLVVPLRRRPGSLEFLSREEVGQRFEFVRRDDGVDVFRNKETGELAYVGRTAAAPTELDPEGMDRVTALYERGVKLIEPYLPLHGDRRAGKHGWWATRRIRKGIGCLEQVAADRPVWNVLWLIGMAYRALGDAQASHANLRGSFELNPSQPDVAREYVAACLALGEGEEAARAALQICRAHPEDAGLRANLGLALLVAGRVEEALEAAREALGLSPDDRITQNLCGLIEDVRAGRRPRPTQLP